MDSQKPLICNGAIAAVEMLCHSAVAAPSVIGTEVMYMPAGLQTITPSQGGRAVQVEVMVDRAGAAALEAQRAALHAKGKRPYFDFNHEDREASFWPTEFYWVGDRNVAAPGIYARGEWSDLGEQAITGKRYRQFSPVFYVDDTRAKPARIVAREDAKPNMGGLVNDPAFHTILPFWAKDAGTSSESDNQTKKDQMNEQELAALRAKILEQQKELDALNAKAAEVKAKKENADLISAEIRAKEFELKANEATFENEALKAKTTKLEAEAKARREADAKAAVEKAVSRGAIAAKDDATKKSWETLIANDPGAAALLDKVSGNGALTPQNGALSAGHGQRVGVRLEDPRAVITAMLALSARQASANQMQMLQGQIARGEAAREFAAIYAREFRGENGARMLDMPLCAADSTDSNLGTLAGTLVTQRTLELLHFQFPSLMRFTTDFSDMPAQFNQTIMTRTITIPGTSDYNTSTGWTDSTAATADVPVTINKHKGVPITFNSNILASTVRRLFEEFAPAQAYALGKQMVDDLYVNITDANFTNNTVVATGSFVRASVITMGTALTLRGVPQGSAFRTLLLYPTVFAQLAQDTSLVTFAAFQKQQMFTDAIQSGLSFAFDVHGFSVHEAANMPTNNGNVTGLACSKSALIIATRIPNDYTSVLPGASYGNVSIVTNPDTGVSVMLVEYVNHQLGTATRRIALMYGTAAGQGAAGQLLKDASGTGSART